MNRSPRLPAVFLAALTVCPCALAADGLDADGRDEAVGAAPPPAAVRAFLAANCADCHADGAAEGGFDLSDDLPASPSLHDAGQWERVVDRVRDGEMPPPDIDEVEDADRGAFVAGAGGWLRDVQRRDALRDGRVRGRRLTPRQLERSLQALLGIDVPLARFIPGERTPGGYSTLAESQSLSHHDLAAHLDAVDAALDEAFRRAATGPDEFSREMTPKDLARNDPDKRCRDPELFRGAAVTWSATLVYYGRISSTRAREDGWYRFTFEVSALKPPAWGVWGTVRTGRCTSSAPLMTDVATFRAGPEPKTVTVTAWLAEGEMFEVRPADARLKMGKTPGGQVGAGEMQPQDVAGIALHGATLERLHRGPDDDGVRALLFGDLGFDGFEPVFADPAADVERLLIDFARRAFRRPVGSGELAPYLAAARDGLAAGRPPIDVLREGYRSLLCSPRFLYLVEEPGELDAYALATRLSYFLTNGPPDAALSARAADGSLTDDAVLSAEVDRLLDEGGGAGRFAADFAREWLDLSEIDATVPERRATDEWDQTLQIALPAQARALLTALLTDDLSVTHLVDADFVLLNERLAAHYEVDFDPPVPADELTRVPLPADSPYGGLMTQGAVLKVTANGSSTSPVLRGVWVSERLLGVRVPPPPQNVPAVEPDVRGARTIREQLALHRSDPACASCHSKVDPPGFALESFDVAGRFRDRYPATGPKIKGRRRRLAVDPSGTLPGAGGAPGAGFADAAEFQRLAASDPDRLARNLAAHLLAYGTGAEPSFADRDALAEVAARAAADGYGVRTLLKRLVLSEPFRTK